MKANNNLKMEVKKNEKKAREIYFLISYEIKTKNSTK